MSTPPIRRDRRHARHDRTRQEILDAAWRAARADGLAGVSLRGLAREMGMEPQSLYTYFASKHAIYDAMFAGANEELLAQQAAAWRAADDPWDRFLTGSRAFVRFATEDPARYLLLFARPVPGFVPSTEAMAVAATVLDGPRQALADLGVDDPDALDLVLAGVSGLVAQQNANQPHGDRWAGLTDRMVGALLTEVGARRPV